MSLRPTNLSSSVGWAPWKPRRSTVAKIFLLCASTILSLVAMEVFLRVISPPSPWSPVLPLRPHHKMELHVKLNGVSPVAINSTNRWGMRGDEPPSDWDQHDTIVTIGGSTTLCFYLDDHKTWPYLLQEKLEEDYPNVWVGNGGIDGHTSRAHIIFMKEVVQKIKPKVVIVLLGHNDLGLSLSEDKRLYGSHFDQNKAGWPIRFFGRSRLFQVLYLWKQIVYDGVHVVQNQYHEDLQPKPLSGSEPPLPEDLRTLLPQLDEFRENVGEMIKIARALDVRIVFLTQPMLYDDTDYWRTKEGAYYWIKQTKSTYSAATYWKFLKVYNKELLAICEREMAECFDLASAVPHSSDYFYDVGHFNEKGAQLVADQVSQYLRTQSSPVSLGKHQAP